MNASGVSTITLPVVSVASGQVYYLKNVAENNCTVSPASGTLDGNASIVLAQWQCITVYWDGSAWHLLSESLSV
jgi:hypothetical protein